ncbi:MAG: hypothetical protein KAY24_17415 [Candidatus Eisenbacteria sp.]|nr:hypothetical protein [Candidatus Eisenbacteria bacterium]
MRRKIVSALQEVKGGPKANRGDSGGTLHNAIQYSPRNVTTIPAVVKEELGNSFGVLVRAF